MTSPSYSLAQAQQDIATLRGQIAMLQEALQLSDATNPPNTPTAGASFYSSGGLAAYAGTDGNQYGVGNGLFTGPPSTLTVTSTTYSTVSGLSMAVSAGTYVARAFLNCTQGGGTYPSNFQVAAPTASACSGTTYAFQANPSSGQTVFGKAHSSFPTSVSISSISASQNFIVVIDLHFTLTASGTLAVQVAQGSSGHNFNVNTGCRLVVSPAQ